MAFGEYGAFDGLGLAGLVASGVVNAGELLEAAIDRAERLNPVLGAIVCPDYARARDAVRRPLPSGAFTGVPFLVKDVSLQWEGTPTRQGSRFVPASNADHNSALMQRFQQAGLVAFAKTNVPEFGLVPTTEGRLYGAAHNPWKLDLSPGGSSGGAAAAVAAGIVPLAHANDGGGSIRIPASCCGLVGLKPSRGRVSAAPDLPDALDGLAADLVVSRSVRDTAAALDAAAGNEPGDPYAAPAAPASFRAAAEEAPRPLRIAFTDRRPDGSRTHADCVAAVEHAARLCRDLGHAVEEAAPEFPAPAFDAAFTDLWCSHLAAAIDDLSRTTGRAPGPDRLENLTLAYYRRGKSVSAARYIASKIVLGRIARDIAHFHSRYDLWLTPTLGEPPWRLGRFDPDRGDLAAVMAEFSAYVPFTPIQNVSGQPAISLPLYWNAAGVPIGVQFAAAFGDELTLLQLATQLERAQPWAWRYESLNSRRWTVV